MSNSGPKDKELAVLLIKHTGIVSEETLTILVDGINDIFSEELEIVWQYEQLCK